MFSEFVNVRLCCCNKRSFYLKAFSHIFTKGGIKSVCLCKYFNLPQKTLPILALSITNPIFRCSCLRGAHNKHNKHVLPVIFWQSRPTGRDCTAQARARSLANFTPARTASVTAGFIGVLLRRV